MCSPVGTELSNDKIIYFLGSATHLALFLLNLHLLLQSGWPTVIDGFTTTLNISWLLVPIYAGYTATLYICLYISWLLASINTGFTTTLYIS